MAWTKTQQITVALLPKFSSVLSLFGSIWIITEVLTDKDTNRRKRNHPYHRLLCAMSIYDVLESLWNFTSSWPIPKGTEGVIWAQGNTASCSAQGYFLMLSVAVPIYNAMLSLYYMLVINFKFTDSTLRRRVEPAMHVAAFIWSFGTATWSTSIGLINNADLWCWIAPLPRDCLDSWRYGDEGNCERGDNAWIYRWGFYFAPLWFCIFMATVCTLMVYRYVRSIDKVSVRYRYADRFSYLNTQVPPSRRRTPTQMSAVSTATNIEPTGRRLVSFAETTSNNPDDSTKNRTHTDLSDVQEHCENDTEQKQSILVGTGSSDDGNINSGESGSGDEEGESDDVGGKNEDDDNVISDSDMRRLQETSSQFGGEVNNSRASIFSRSRRASISVRQAVESWRESRAQYREEYKRSWEVYHQALYYLGTFYATHVWSTSNRIVQFANGGTSFFALTAIHSFFDPLQGFLNYLVYQRPRYLRIRKQYPKAGRIVALYRILRFSYMGEPDSWGAQESTFPVTQTNLSVANNAGSQNRESTGSVLPSENEK